MKKLNSVMIVDDDQITNFIYNKVITKSKLTEEVIIKTTVQDAINFLNKLAEKRDYENFPSLIFLDINMPVLTGWDFLESYEKLLEAFKAKVMILSSSIYNDDISKAKTYQSVKDYVVKPLTEDRIQAIYKKYFAK